MQKSTFLCVSFWVLTLYSTWLLIWSVIPSAHYLVKGTENVVGQLVYIIGTTFAILAVCATWAFTLHFTYKSTNHKKVK